MKKLPLVLFVLASTSVFAQSSSTTTTTDISSPSSRSILQNFSLTLESEIMTEKDEDQNYDITGYSSFYEIEPGYKFTKKISVSAAAQYTVSEKEGNEERKNRDTLGTVYTKFNYKLMSLKNGDIADVKLQARAYADQDQFLKDFYGSDGNYQMRAYFGAPLAGGFYINKYNSYVRYKKYNANDNASKFSRDYEYRLRVNPAYKLSFGTEVGVSATYNHIFKQGAGFGQDEENIEIDFSARHQIDKIAVMVRAGTSILDNSETGELKTTVNAADQVAYALNIEAYVF